MILRADKRFTLETSAGHKIIYEGEFFKTESRQVLLGGYAHKLSREEAREVLDEYVTFAKEVFGIED